MFSLSLLGHFDMMNIPPMQNPNDIYPYFPASLYQPFGTFDDHNQWGSADTSGNVPPPQAPIPFHPQMYTPSPLEIPRSPFDYPPHPPHAYPHYHHGFNPSTYAGPPSTAASVFDMSWNPHSLSMQQMQVAASQQMTPIGGGLASNKKPSVYDDYPAAGVGDMLAQHMNSVDLGGGATNDDAHHYDNGNNDNSANVNALSSKEQQQQQQQQHYQSNPNNLSLSSRSSQPPQTSSSNGPKSYASVVSSDMINPNSNKPTSSAPNNSLRSNVQSSANERNDNATPNFPSDSNNSRANPNFRGANNNNNQNYYSQQTRNGTGGYNSRNQQQQQQSSASGGFQNWPNNNLPGNARGNNNNSSTTYYNSGSSNYYDRSSYNQQQGTPTNNKRQNSNYQQNYSSRTANNLSNGNASAPASGHRPASSTSLELLETLKRNHQYNPPDFNFSPKGARFFVIKSVRTTFFTSLQSFPTFLLVFGR